MPPGSTGAQVVVNPLRAAAGNESLPGNRTPRPRRIAQVNTTQLPQQPHMAIPMLHHTPCRPIHTRPHPGPHHRRTHMRHTPNLGEQSHLDMQVNRSSTQDTHRQHRRIRTDSNLPLLLMATLHQVPLLHQVTTLPLMADNIRCSNNPSSRGSRAVVLVDQDEC